MSEGKREGEAFREGEREGEALREGEREGGGWLVVQKGIVEEE